MPHVEFGNLYKFIASIGVLLMAAAVALPWLFAQSLSFLTIPADDLDGLTDGARATLIQRQEAAAVVQALLPWASAALFIIGLSLLWWGLRKWRSAQEWQDRGEQAETSRKEAEALKSKAEVEPLPRDATEAKLESEVDESIEDAAPAVSGAEVQSSSTPMTAAHREAERRARMEALRGYESRTVGLLSSAYSSAFHVSENVRLTTGKAVGVAFDAFLDPKPDTPWAQLAVDVKALPLRFADTRIFESIMRMAVGTRDIGGGSVYTGTRGRPRDAEASGAYVFILEEEGQDLNLRLPRLLERVESANSVLRRPVGIILVTAARFETLQPDELRDALATVWSGSSGSTVTLV